MIRSKKELVALADDRKEDVKMAMKMTGLGDGNDHSRS